MQEASELSTTYIQNILWIGASVTLAIGGILCFILSVHACWDKKDKKDRENNPYL